MSVYQSLVLHTSLSIALLLISSVGATVLYVSPTEQASHVPSPDQPFYTLDQLAMNVSSIVSNISNLKLLFLDGVHNLTQNLTITGIDEVMMCTAACFTANFYGMCTQKATINVYPNRFVSFQKVPTVRMINLRLLGQKLLYSEPIVFINVSRVNVFEQHHVEIHNFTIVISSRSTCYYDRNATVSLTLSKYTHSKLVFKLQNARLHLVDSYFTYGSIELNQLIGCPVYTGEKHTLILSCAIISSTEINFNIGTNGRADRKLYAEIRNTSIITKDCFPSCTFLFGVNVKLREWCVVDLKVLSSTISQISFNTNSESQLWLTFQQVFLNGNMLDVGSDSFITSKGNSITQASFSYVDLRIENSEIRALGFGLTLYLVENSNSVLRISNSQFYHNHRAMSIISKGGSFRLFVSNTIILSTMNAGKGAVTIDSQVSKSLISFYKCTFDRNFGQRGAALRVIASKESVILLSNVSFIGNTDLSLTPSIVFIVKCRNISINSCVFAHNTGTSVEVYESRTFFSGNTSFISNVAYRGGALALINSVVLFHSNLTIIFASNLATDVGGAIYVNSNQNELYFPRFSRYARTISKCFFQFPLITSKEDFNTMNVTLKFQNNSAANGGEIMYGTPLFHTCFLTGSRIVIISVEEIKTIFQFNNSVHSSLSSISSDPKRVCLCDESGVPQCANVSYIYLNKTAFPGEKLTISLVLVGDEFGTVTGPVYANLLGETTGSLGSGQHMQWVSYKHCNHLEYSVHSHTTIETVIFAAKEVLQHRKYSVDTYTHLSEFEYPQTRDIPRELLSVLIHLTVKLLHCPPGFILTGSPPACQCHSTLQENGLRHCVIMNHTGVIYRSGTVWVNATFNTSTSNGVVVHKYCPYGYCKRDNTSVDLRYPDMQCALGHSGILCGGCQHNLSLAIGSDKCLQCENSNHLSLFIFFALAGILLVSFIIFFNFTTAKGTINGLVFYANIVWAHQSILFTADENESVAQNVVKVFIAWLNLDFGIETCFAQGLDGYSKTWLQFVFPLYVWGIAGFMIASSHYSSLATRVFGNNSVPVLATLFLMSYAKLLRTIITCLGFALLNYPDQTVTVWLYDGNVPYFGVKHAFLFIAALFALIFLWLPFMSTLLLVPWLKGKTHLKPLRWINRWKPFYDAYYGPFKVRHQYWVGVLLAVRAVMFILFATTSAVAPSINLVAMVVIPAALLLYTSYIGMVYQNKLLGLLENCFFLNLIILGGGSLYQIAVGSKTSTVVYVSVGFAFLLFICIVLYHSFIVFKDLVQKCCKRKPAERVLPQRAKMRDNRRGSCNLREELLESDDQL